MLQTGFKISLTWGRGTLFTAVNLLPLKRSELRFSALSDFVKEGCHLFPPKWYMPHFGSNLSTMILFWVPSQTGVPLQENLCYHPASVHLSACAQVLNNPFLRQMAMQHEIDPTKGIAFVQIVVTMLGCSGDSFIYISFSFLCGRGRYRRDQECQSVSCASVSHSLAIIIIHTCQVNRIHILSPLFFYDKKCDKSLDTLKWGFPKKIHAPQQSRKIRLWLVIDCNVNSS